MTREQYNRVREVFYNLADELKGNKIPPRIDMRRSLINLEYRLKPKTDTDRAIVFNLMLNLTIANLKRKEIDCDREELREKIMLDSENIISKRKFNTEALAERVFQLIERKGV